MLIAKSTLWEPKPPGYFGSALLTSLSGLPISAGPSNFFRLLVVDRNFGGEGGTTNYDLSFHQTLSLSVSMRKFLEFLGDIETCFSMPAPGVSLDDHEYNRAAEQDLDASDLDDDESIESRYLLA